VLKAEHCGEIIILLLTVVISHVFSLEAADGESEICARPTASEAVKDSRYPHGCPVNEFSYLSCFFLVPGYILLML
jgi:hypothetical protein